MARVAVIGHVEWVLQARAQTPVESGEIVQLYDTFEEPGGGGGVAARALPSLGAETCFFTALGDDEAARATERVLRREGCELRIGQRANPQNRVTTISDPAGERTIFVHGPNDHPAIEDPLDWDDLAGFDGVFYTGDDPATVVAARAARVLVATARRLASVVASGVRVDVLAGSANDRGEHYDVEALPVRPRLCVWTDGARGGRYLADDGSEGRWEAVAPPGPIVDAYGAGDVFMAALTLELARGAGRDDALAGAARAAAAQLTHRGGGTDLIRHLYVHVPFCAHRCGYCDFVTVTGHADLHERYVAAVLVELEQERARLAPALETVFIGGGTPTLLGAALLDRLLGGLPDAPELTVECNPETVDDELAAVLAGRGVRVSLGAQSFGHEQLAVLERRATPEQVRAAAHLLRGAGVENLSLDLLFGVPGQGRAELDRDLGEALALGPEHLSCYELEAKPGTRFSHRHGAALKRQAELLEDHYEHVIARLGEAGYRWYETANFCRDDRRAQHNLAYWTGRDYLGIGIGAVSTIGLERRTNRPSLAGFVDALERAEEPPRAIELLTPEERARERLLLGLRLDVPLATAGLEPAIDPEGLARMASLGLIEPADGTLRLTPRGRLLANDVVSSVIA